MERTVESLYDAWLECRNSQFESEPFLEPIIKRYCYWHGGTDEKVDIKGKVFNAAYEIYIYAFFAYDGAVYNCIFLGNTFFVCKFL